MGGVSSAALAARYMQVPFHKAIAYNRESWMSEMSDHIGETPLINLRIPGTHNSASYSIHSKFWNASACQNADIREQLIRGVRYLDLRIGCKFEGAPGDVRIGHEGHIWGISFEHIVDDIAWFVANHPKEFLIVEIGHGADLEDFSKTFIREEFVKKVGQWMVKSEDNFDIGKVTMNELWGKDKRLWVFFDDEQLLLNIDYHTARSQGIFPRSENIYGRHTKTASHDKMYSHAMDQLKEAQPGQKEHKKILKTTLTLAPETSGKSEKGVRDLTHNVQRGGENKKWFVDRVSEGLRLNIIAVDFIFGSHEDFCEGQLHFIDTIIKSNSRHNGHPKTEATHT